MQNTAIQVVNLSCNLIGDEGAKYVAEAITRNITLREIDLSQNIIGERGARYLAEAIKQNTTLQEINLSRIGPYFKARIAECLKDNILRKRKAYREFLCAFTQDREDWIRIGFDRMILKFVYYPLIEISFEDKKSCDLPACSFFFFFLEKLFFIFS